MKEKFKRKNKSLFVAIPTVFNADASLRWWSKLQNVPSALEAQSTVRLKHRPLMVTNILCGSGFFLFSHIFVGVGGNSTMNTIENSYCQHNQVYDYSRIKIVRNLIFPSSLNAKHAFVHPLILFQLSCMRSVWPLCQSADNTNCLVTVHAT